jgi:hypothetical protein
MKIWLGGEDSVDLDEKVKWLQNNFHKDQYTITDDGFIINDYYVKFAEERYATLFRLQWG